MSQRRRRWLMLTISEIYLGVFDYHVKVVLGPQEKAVAFAHWFFGDEGMQYDRRRRGACIHKEGMVPVIWLPRRPRTSREHGTMAHEALHAVGHVTRWAAIQHCEATEEVFCHALAHIVNGILSNDGTRR